MNRNHAIDDVLDAWFVDGASHMPDRLFEAVLDQVERAPQRRRRWAPARVRTMSLQLRLAAAAALIILIGGSAWALVGRGPDQPDTGQTLGPLPSASSFMSGRVTMRLFHTFIGEPRPKPSSDVPDESIITFSTRTLGVDRGLDWWFTYDVEYFPSEVFATAPEELRLVSTEKRDGCAVGDAGTYAWSLTPRGTKLHVNVVDDQCRARAEVLAGDWLRADCQDPLPPDGLCLGTLEAGDYTSQYFDPFQAPGPGWRARYGVLRYTVPDGWENLQDEAWNYHLHRVGDPPDSGIFLFGDVRIWDQGEDCAATIDQSVGTAARPILEWLQSTDGIDAGIPRDIRLGGITGMFGSRLDVRMDPAWTATCPFSGGKPFRGLFVDSDPAESGTAWGLLPDTRMRLFVFQLPDQRTMVIAIEAPDDPTWDGLVEDATRVVEGMLIQVPAP